MISGYVKCEQGQKALDLFQQMQQEGVELDPITLVGVLNACASVVALDEAMHAHELIMQRGWDSDVFLGSSLVDIYAKCGSMHTCIQHLNKSDRVWLHTFLLLLHLSKQFQCLPPLPTSHISEYHCIPSDYISRWHLVVSFPCILHASIFCIHVNQAIPHNHLHNLLVSTLAIFEGSLTST